MTMISDFTDDVEKCENCDAAEELKTITTEFGEKDFCQECVWNFFEVRP